MTEKSDDSVNSIRLDQGIAVDAAHSTKNKMTEYRGVDLSTGEILFHKKLGNQTINIGEFMAIVDAAKYILEHDFRPRIIFSDSTTGITWYKNKRTASEKKYAQLMKAEIFLRSLAFWIDNIEVIKWDNRLWGEIPADFNRK